MLLQPSQYRKILDGIERDKIDAAAFDERGDDALRRQSGDSRNPGNLMRELERQGLIRRLHGEQARRNIYKSCMWNYEKVSAHACKACRYAVTERPAGDEARKTNTNAEHHGRAQEQRAQRPAPDVLCT
jgi:hypothetical protein